MKFSELREANLSKAQIKKVHDKADDLPKNDFIKRYGKEGDSVRFATATKMVKKELGIEDYEEGFKSDAQRKAAFASGYKEKGKKKDEMFSTRSLGLKGASKRSRDKAREKDKDSEKSKKKEDLDEAKFTPAQVSALKDKYGKLGPGAEKNAVQMDKLAKMMSKYSKSHLSQLADMGVPMVSKVAKELMK